MNILVVDDERDQLESLRRGLRSRHYQTVEAINACEAINALKSGTSIDLVITDYAMPETNGMELLEQIREKRFDLPVIMMTAYGDKHLVVRALRNHCSGYIEKPFTLDQLLDEIQKVIACKLNPKAISSDTICRMAHQINNPLMAIIGSAEMCLEDNQDSLKHEDLERLENIIGAAGRIELINRQIMGLGRIMTEPPAPVDILKILGQSLEMYKDLLKRKQVEARVKHNGTDYIAAASPFGLEQVFKNLILNAIEAMQECDPRQISITVGRFADTRQIQITLEDTGSGIEPSRLSKIFTPYYTNKSNGNGLGLAVVKSIIEQFNGTLQVRSRLGKGTIFNIVLPAA